METLSDKIRNCTDGAVNNPYQGTDKKVLFVCTMGILRSATAARMYAKKYNTRAAGTHPEALILLTEMLIQWADEIVFVNSKNYKQAWDMYPKELFRNNKTTYTVLNIPDDYEHGHPEMIKAFEEQYERL